MRDDSDMAKKEKPKGETDSLLKAAHNAIRTNYIEVVIDNSQLNCKCRLCRDRDETVNQIISECSKLAQKEYKIRYDWMGTVIYWELCKRLKVDHIDK